MRLCSPRRNTLTPRLIKPSCRLREERRENTACHVFGTLGRNTDDSIFIFLCIFFFYLSFFRLLLKHLFGFFFLPGNKNQKEDKAKALGLRPPADRRRCLRPILNDLFAVGRKGGALESLCRQCYYGGNLKVAGDGERKSDGGRDGWECWPSQTCVFLQ